MRRAAAAAVLLSIAAIAAAPVATADNGNNGGPGGGRDIDMDIGLPSGGIVLILCPGVGQGVNILSGLGTGGWCDYGFSPGGAHIHCAWGGSAPFAAGWECHRVWRGQPDYPILPDPDVVPLGAPPRPDALWGPSPDDQAPGPEAPQPETEMPGSAPLLPAIGSR
jgi:hypothetical protein